MTAMQEINTAVGSMSVPDGVKYVFENSDKTAHIVGILGQLKKVGANWEARHAAKHILAAGNRYEAKAIKLANEIVSRKKVGPQKFDSESDLRKLCSGLYVGTVLKVTLKTHAVRQGPISINILEEHGGIEENLSRRVLLQAVIMSGSWDHTQNRTHNLTLTKDFDNFEFARLMFPVVETVEIVSQPERPIDPNEAECRKLLADNPDVWFDKNTFDEVCDSWGFDREKERFIYLSPNPTMEEVLGLFWGWLSAKDFLTDYLEKFGV